jgi:hypothetical protein
VVPPLFHFSDDPAVELFAPRAVRTPSERPPGLEWLNGPLVWAIDEWHQPMYLFPRDCPRILLWRTPATRADDAERYFGTSGARIVAYVEEGWLGRLETARLHRYELPVETFVPLHDAGMWVSRAPVRPLRRVDLDRLPVALRDAGVELRVLPDLTPLKPAWDTTLHASGIRLRNALNWRD